MTAKGNGKKRKKGREGRRGGRGKEGKGKVASWLLGDGRPLPQNTASNNHHKWIATTIRNKTVLSSALFVIANG